MKVVEGGDGRGEVALGRVELLDVSRYLLDHSLALPGLVLDVSEDMHKPHWVVVKKDSFKSRLITSYEIL